MVFGFVVERVGLFLFTLLTRDGEPLQGGLSFWIGLSFILLSALTSAMAARQSRKLLRTLTPQKDSLRVSDQPRRLGQPDRGRPRSWPDRLAVS
ncbi:hypothetical protein [Desulfobulbus propionicus]